jgi:hypothetical protein
MTQTTCLKSPKFTFPSSRRSGRGTPERPDGPWPPTWTAWKNA